MITIDADFPRGTCPVRVFGDPADRAAPIVLFFMDGFGPRDALFTMGERLAALGYRVALPHLFYDHLPNAGISVQGVLTGGEDKDRLMAMLGKLDQAAIDADVGALIDFVTSRLGDEAPIGATGYCMGGRYALTAATVSPRVRFAAAFHGANLAPGHDAGPHQRFAGVGATIYVGIAGPDKGFGAEEEGRLATALREAGVEHMIETYPGAPHGFALPDLPMHREAAGKRHWDRLETGLREAFGG